MVSDNLIRKVNADTPIPPNVVTSNSPIEEQLAQALEITLILDHEKSEVKFILIFECLKTYTFMLIIMPRRIAVIFEITKLTIASSGR